MVPRHSYMPETMYQVPIAIGTKNHAVPFLHRDNYLAKVPGPCPVTASGNAYKSYRRAVRRNRSHSSTDEGLKKLFINAIFLYRIKKPQSKDIDFSYWRKFQSLWLNHF